MLAKKFRLQIQDWFKKREKTAVRKSDFFIIRFRPNSLPFSRFGILISRKISRGATKRNKIKRIIFNLIRLKKLQKFTKRDVLITVLAPTTKLTKTEIKKEIEKLI